MLASRWTSLWLSSPGKCPIGTPNGAAFEQEMSRKKCPGTGIGSSAGGTISRVGLPVVCEGVDGREHPCAGDSEASCASTFHSDGP